MNSSPIWRGSASRAAPDNNRNPLSVRRVPQETVTAGGETEPEQKFALRHRPEGGQPKARRGLLERGEIDMSGEIGLARQGERIGETMAAAPPAAYRLARTSSCP